MAVQPLSLQGSGAPAVTLDSPWTQYSFGTEAMTQVLEKNGCRAVDTPLGSTHGSACIHATRTSHLVAQLAIVRALSHLTESSFLWSAFPLAPLISLLTAQRASIKQMVEMCFG